MNKLKIYKMFEEAHLPVYGSDWAACFDLKASIRIKDIITVYTSNNNMFKLTATPNKEGKVAFSLKAGYRALVPTGLIFDLDETQSLRVHPRSGLSIKEGIILANCEGVVDGDYVHQSYITAFNVSNKVYEIVDGARLAQAEIVENNPVEFEVVTEQPRDKTNRKGGFGSTGK